MGIPVGRRGNSKRRVRYDLLAQWYGDDRASVEISAHTMQPTLISSVVDEVLMEPGKSDNLNVIAGLQAQWPQLVGGCFAAYTEPKSLNNGKLTVEVRHSALIAELAISKDLFINAVNKISAGICSEVIFTMGNSARTGQKKHF